MAVTLTNESWSAEQYFKATAYRGKSTSTLKAEASSVAIFSILSFLELSRKLDAGGLSKDLINIVNNKTDAILSSSDNQCLLEELPDLIEKLEIKMKDAAKELNFEEAANLRDRIKKLRQKLARNN